MTDFEPARQARAFASGAMWPARWRHLDDHCLVEMPDDLVLEASYLRQVLGVEEQVSNQWLLKVTVGLPGYLLALDVAFDGAGGALRVIFPAADTNDVSALLSARWMTFAHRRAWDALDMGDMHPQMITFPLAADPSLVARLPAQPDLQRISDDKWSAAMPDAPEPEVISGWLAPSSSRPPQFICSAGVQASVLAVEQRWLVTGNARSQEVVARDLHLQVRAEISRQLAARALAAHRYLLLREAAERDGWPEPTAPDVLAFRVIRAGKSGPTLYISATDFSNEEACLRVHAALSDAEAGDGGFYATRLSQDDGASFTRLIWMAAGARTKDALVARSSAPGVEPFTFALSDADVIMLCQRAGAVDSDEVELEIVRLATQLGGRPTTPAPSP